MNKRDFDYVEQRLLAPAVPAAEAVGRLKQAGEVKAAAELSAALRDFNDKCREIRRELGNRPL